MSKGSRNRERRHQAALAKKARKTAARQKKRARAADQAARVVSSLEFDNFLQYGPAKPTTIRLYQGELEKLDRFCEKAHISRSEAIRYVIDETTLLD